MWSRPDVISCHKRTGLYMVQLLTFILTNPEDLQTYNPTHTLTLIHCSTRASSRSRDSSPAYVSIRRHTSAYVGIRQHTLARVRAIRRQHLIHEPRCAVVVACIRQHTSACVSIRQQTSANVSIRRSRLHLLGVSACSRTYMRRQLLKRQ